jgi:hypothetical protein
MSRDYELLLECLACSIILRLGAFALTTAELATGEAVELAPIALLLGLHASLPISLGTITLPYAVFYPLRGKKHYLLLLAIPIIIATLDFANDLGVAFRLGVMG